MTDLAASTSRGDSLARHGADLLRLGLPLIGSHMAHLAVQVTDTVMLGWYDVEALAAVVLGSTYFFVLMITGAGFAFAVMPVVAAEEDSGDTGQVRRVTRMGLWLSGIYAALTLPLLLMAEPILLAVGQTPQIAADAGAYLRIAGWGLIPSLGTFVLKSYLAALGRTKIVFWAVVAAAVLNGLANYALIFGNWGAPEMGIRGAAIASVVTNVAMLAALAVYAVRVLPQHELFVRLWRPDWPAFAQVFRLGWPIGLTNLAEVGLFAATAVLMGWIGTVELAAHGIALQISSATFLVHLGLSNAATIRAGAAWGRRDMARLRRGAVAATALSAVVAGVTVLLFLALPEPLIGLFLDPDDPARPAVLAFGVMLLAFAAVFQAADAAQVMALGFLRGMQDTRVPLVIAAVSYWVVGIPASYALGFPLGLGGPGIWMGLVIGLTLAGVLLMVRFWQRV